MTPLFLRFFSTVGFGAEVSEATATFSFCGFRGVGSTPESIKMITAQVEIATIIVKPAKIPLMPRVRISIWDCVLAENIPNETLEIRNWRRFGIETLVVRLVLVARMSADAEGRFGPLLDLISLELAIS